MGPGTDRLPGLGFGFHIRDGYTIAELSGELDIVCAPTLREQLLGVLRPDANRLVVDLSRVDFCDASGLAVLVGTGRRAELLGGVLRLVAPTPQVMLVLRTTGLQRKLDIFFTVLAATTNPKSSQPSPHRISREATAEVASPPPAMGHAVALDIDELRQVVAALLADIDTWHEADPGRRFAPTLHVLARAYARFDDTALTQAARSLVSALSRHPLTPFPAVATAANRLRRIIETDHPSSADTASGSVRCSTLDLERVP